MMRNIISQQLDISIMLGLIKKKLDANFNGKWSVVYGSGFKTYLDPKIIKEYMWFQCSTDVFLIFKKV